MRLSQIKLAGFKSFVDPTHILLPGQIVGVVGPNGCGKSNVIDALRWVLGESKASALRGESMQDVIFNGSGKRKPVARASVELVFDNSLGKAIGQWSSYAEISIKRVLQRNGDSSYLINNQKVRRRDITDIFLGTGLGARAYAIVEQGMISRIIEAKPEELRVFLEEAAGVSRYRDRRRETSQRLTGTRDNLLRIGDILLEMDKQLEHLAVQAETARQYRELESRRTIRQHLLWLIKKQEALALQAGFAEHIEKTRSEFEMQAAKLRETESRIERERSDHYRFSDALHATQGELYAANAEVARIELQMEHERTQQQRLQLQIENATRQIEQQRGQRLHLTTQLEHWQREQEDAEVNLVRVEQDVAFDGDILPQAEAALQASREHYNGLLREQLKLQQQIQLNETKCEHLSRNVQQMHSRLARLLQEQGSLPVMDNDGLQQSQEELFELEIAHQQNSENLAALQVQMPQANKLRETVSTALQQQEQQMIKTEARLHALQQMQSQLDSDRNLKGWLNQHGLDELPRLWQSIRIEAGWENALEAVLRERLNAVQTADVVLSPPPVRLALYSPGDSLPVVRDAGNLTVASEPAVGQERMLALSDANFKPIPLLNHVHCQDEQVLPVMREWLLFIYAVDNLEQACQFRETLPESGVFVTREGHLVGLHSVLFHAPDSQLHGVLSRQREIERLELESAEYARCVTKTRQELSDAQLHCRTIDEQISPLQRKIHEQKLSQHGLQMQILKLNQAHERSVERNSQIVREMHEVGAQLQNEQGQLFEIESQMGELRDELSAFQARVDEGMRQVNAQEVALREQRERVRQLQHARQEAHFYSRTCADKIADLHQGNQNIVDTLMNAEQNIQLLQAELSDSFDDTAAQSLQSALQARQLAESALSLARVALENATVQLQAQEQERMSCEHSLGQLRELLGEQALKEQEARLYAEQWAVQLQGVDEQALLPQLAGAKPAQLQSELTRLNGAIEALGAVNLAALEELQAASERKGYLDAQAQDLQAAIATLEDAIRHIDRESRDLLMDTYDKVNSQLAELFPILFAGGEARLVLTGDEILDGGVQVMAQPPGKKNSSIHLLSGGEKALTAIALIFSLFQLNPAPFCLLDEVDAPLDDTNTERLCALVRKMAQHTQFVFISHNKIAMEMAQQLIGVTMQEKGVSKVVSVDIEAALRMRDE